MSAAMASMAEKKSLHVATKAEPVSNVKLMSQEVV
jgi:hypothetical protein